MKRIFGEKSQLSQEKRDVKKNFENNFSTQCQDDLCESIEINNSEINCCSKSKQIQFFLPNEIFTHKFITPLEKLLFAAIQSFFDEKHDGCMASNDELAKLLYVRKSTIAKALSNLRKFGLIKDIVTNGRQRIIRLKFKTEQLYGICGHL